MLNHVSSSLRMSQAIFILALIVALVVPASATKVKDHEKRRGRPIALGVSGGNIEGRTQFELAGIPLPVCYDGTLGALLKDNQGRLFILSTNFALAKTNEGKPGEPIVQPGLIESGCAQKQNDVVAVLTSFKKIKFGGGTNTVDLAIAETVPEAVKKSGEILGIGKVSSQPKKANVGLRVKKAGGGTAVTKGTVTAVNVTGNIGYIVDDGVKFDFKVARFKNQIVVSTEDPSKSLFFPEDSGSLVVEDTKDCPAPIGVAIYGSSSVMVVNPIDKVLNAAKNLKPTGKKTIVGCGNAKANSQATASSGAFESTAKSSEYVDPAEKELIRFASRAKRRVENRLLDLPGVVAVGVSLDKNRNPVILLMVESDNQETRDAIPVEIGGFPTDVLVTGKFLVN